VNASFRGETKPEELVVDKIPLWEQPLLRDIAKLLVGLIALLVLVLSVLRPLVRGLLGSPRPMQQLQTAAMQATALPAGAVAALPGDNSPAPLDYDGQIAAARTLVSQDPARVAQVVKTWVGNDE
jgi:flagellar M-ring protein FliF